MLTKIEQILKRVIHITQLVCVKVVFRLITFAKWLFNHSNQRCWLVRQSLLLAVCLHCKFGNGHSFVISVNVSHTSGHLQCQHLIQNINCAYACSDQQPKTKSLAKKHLNAIKRFFSFSCFKLTRFPNYQGMEQAALLMDKQATPTYLVDV